MTIDRPADQVWPWVTQLGQGRAGLYSYDWLENALLADVQSASQVRPDLQYRLEVGDRVIRMTRYAPHNPVALYQPGHALVLGGVQDTDEQLAAGHPSSTWAFIVEPVNDRQCRLVIRSRASRLDARLQEPIQFVMQHKMMLEIKQRAEGTWSRSGGDVAVPISWFAAAAVAALHAIRALHSRRREAAALAALASVVVQLLMFWDITPATRTALLGAVVGSALPPSGGRR